MVEAATQHDIRVAILVAREHAPPFAVQATGHGTVAPSDGGLARPSPDAGPAGHRDVPFSVAALAPYDKGAPAERVDGHMDRLVARLRLHATGGSFLNFLTDPAMTRTAYTTHDYRRLTHAKRIWDPDNFFHRNHNIPPR